MQSVFAAGRDVHDDRIRALRFGFNRIGAEPRHVEAAVVVEVDPSFSAPLATFVIGFVREFVHSVGRVTEGFYDTALNKASDI